MSGVTALLPPRAAYTTEAIYRLSVEQYHDLIAAGTLTEDDPVELIEGLLVYRMPKNKPHTAAVRRLRQAITPLLLPADFFYDAEQPITLRDSETEPDGLVVRGRIQNFDTRPVQPSDLSLVIEVSDPTLTRGRTVKLRSYARAAVPCYGIVNLIDRQIELHTDPDPAADPPQLPHAHPCQTRRAPVPPDDPAPHRPTRRR